MDTAHWYGGNWSWIIVLSVLEAAVVLLLVSFYGPRRKRRDNLPPGPPNWPIFGALLSMDSQTHKGFEKLAKMYGPIIYFRLGFHDVVVVSSSEIAKELLRIKDGEFCDRAAHSIHRTGAKYAGFESIVYPFANNTAQLKLIRKISISEFFTVAKLKSYEDLREKEVAVMLEKIWSDLDKFNESNQESTICIRGVSTDAILNIVVMLCLGRRFDGASPTEELSKLPQIVDDFLSLFMQVNLVDFLPWKFLEWMDPQGLVKRFKDFEKRQEHFYGTILEEQKQLRNRRNCNADATEQRSKNFVDFLLDLQDQGKDISDKAVMATVLSMWVAGTDSNATAVEWTMLELIRHPQILKRLQEEIDRVVGENRAVLESDFEDLPFLNAVMSESLRLHPVLPFTFPHVSQAPSTLGGYNIPAKAAVVVNIYSIGRDPKVWKDPLEFYPDRFMPGENSPTFSFSSSKLAGNDYNMIPFGSGRRSCVGSNLAVVFTLLVIASLVHAFDWSPPQGMTEELGTSEHGVFILHPRNRLLLCARPRLQRHVYQSGLHVN